MTRIFIDTNVLFPFSVMDLMFALSEDGVHDVMWTDRLLEEWERVIVDGPDPDDRFHIAAAIATRVSTLITWNIADFQSTELDRNGVFVTDPDTYLQGLLAEIPDEVAATIRRLAASKRRPPMTATDLTDALAKAGVPHFASAIRERLTSHT